MEKEVEIILTYNQATTIEMIENLIIADENLLNPLRLMILYSLIQNGISSKVYDQLKREFFYVWFNYFQISKPQLFTNKQFSHFNFKSLELWGRKYNFDKKSRKIRTIKSILVLIAMVFCQRCK